MFRINPDKTSREEKKVPNTVRASNRIKPITVSQPPVEAEVEEHHRNLLLSKNNKHISSACNNIKIDSQDNQKEKVSVKEIQMKYQPKVTKPKKVEHQKSLATPKSRKPRFLLRWSLTGKMFYKTGKIVASSESKSQSDCSNGDNTCTSNAIELKIKRFPNSTSLLDRNDHVAAILGFGDLLWGNILITRVYFVEGLGHNLFSVGQFYDSDLEVAFRRNACFIRNLEGVNLLKGDRSTNLFTINLQEMASVSPICLMDRASSTKSWLWHQHLSHLNFDTINDLARNDLIAGLPKFKYHKEHLCPSSAILGFGDLLWGNILITRVYFVEGLGYNLFSVGQFYDSDLEVAFRRNACFVRNLEGVDLLKGDRSTNLFTINLQEMASVSPICLMARASSTKSWLWHQHLSHLNFDTINDLARNDLIAGLPKFKYHKEHLCPS
nr:retrovirus-related Pol polyprotein from transposon TNT 1-94 [Tanacetum cinerariifolium]